jgi:DNA-binding NarL/FixJ family response regulator
MPGSGAGRWGAAAARALSNGQIAERLSLSVRTVESHIYRATTKLGLHDRAALATFLTGERASGSHAR